MPPTGTVSTADPQLNSTFQTTWRSTLPYNTIGETQQFTEGYTEKLFKCALWFLISDWTPFDGSYQYLF
jgi:hypothetical protein